jgi:hypothetical protein
VTLMSELTFAPSFRFANAITGYLLYFRRDHAAEKHSASSWESPARGKKPPAPDQQLTAETKPSRFTGRPLLSRFYRLTSPRFFRK